jgi:hypothetical protein
MDVQERELIVRIATALERIADALEDVSGENHLGEGFLRVVVGGTGDSEE